jgi:hypothetical protein
MASTPRQAQPQRPYNVGDGLVIGNYFEFGNPESSKRIYSHESREALARRNDLSEFVQLDPERLRMLWRSCKRHPDECIVTDLLVGLVVCGMFKFIVGGKNAIDNEGKQTDEEEAYERGLSAVWGKFTEDMMRARFDIGFVPVAYVPHATYKYRPVVIDPTKVDIFFHRNILSEETYVYRTKRTGNSSYGGVIKNALNGKEASLSADDEGILPGIITFTFDAPGNDGEILSMMAKCLASRALLNERIALRSIAEAERARPFFATTLETKTHVEENIGLDASKKQLKELEDKSSAIIAQIARNSMVLPPGVTIKSEREEGRPPMSVDRRRIENDATGYGKYGLKLVTTQSERCVNLPEGRKTAAIGMAEAPLDIPQMQKDHKELVAQLGGVPAAVVMPELVRSGIANDIMSDARLKMTEASLRQWVSDVLHEVYHMIHDNPVLLYYINNTDKPTIEGAKDAMAVQIVMPNVPVPEEAKELYTMGLLTQEAYQRTVIQRCHFRKKDFNAVAKPPAVEYSEPKVPAAGGAKKKPKAKKKKKTKGSLAMETDDDV